MKAGIHEFLQQCHMSLAWLIGVKNVWQLLQHTPKRPLQSSIQHAQYIHIQMYN
jgi:hypothetical protein